MTQPAGDNPQDVTQFCARGAKGDRGARRAADAARLRGAVYRRAHWHMAREKSAMLQATALVNEIS